MLYRHGLGGLLAVLLGLLSSNAARADLIFVTNIGPSGEPGEGTIGKYTTSGATVNPALITGLDRPQGIAISGSDLACRIHFHFDKRVNWALVSVTRDVPVWTVRRSPETMPRLTCSCNLRKN